MTPTRWRARLAQGLLVGALVACGSKPPVEPSPPVNTNTITITSAGVSPKNIQVALGSRVLFINNDTRSHWMASDPHPDHTDCPEFDQVGTLLPGQMRETGNLVVPQTCGFHDHNLASSSSLQGRVIIQ